MYMVLLIIRLVCLIGTKGKNLLKIVSYFYVIKHLNTYFNLYFIQQTLKPDIYILYSKQ